MLWNRIKQAILMRHRARTESPSPTSPLLQSGISIALATTLPTPENFFARTSSGYGSHIVSLATSDFAPMDSALANFRRGEARGRRESRAHSPLTPTKSSPIRKPSLPTDLLFLVSGL